MKWSLLANAEPVVPMASKYSLIFSIDNKSQMFKFNTNYFIAIELA